MEKQQNDRKMKTGGREIEMTCLNDASQEKKVASQNDLDKDIYPDFAFGFDVGFDVGPVRGWVGVFSRCST